MVSSSVFLLAMAVSNYCEEPVKPSQVEYFKGNVADRFPPGHVFDDMARMGNRSEMDLPSLGRSPEWTARLDKSKFALGQSHEALSAITGIPLPHSEVRKLELLRKKLFAAPLKEGQSPTAAKTGEEPKNDLPELDDGSPRTIKEFNERVERFLGDSPKRGELVKALRANQAANKSTGLDDNTLRKLEREDDERMRKYMGVKNEHERENKELEKLKKD